MLVDGAMPKYKNLPHTEEEDRDAAIGTLVYTVEATAGKDNVKYALRTNGVPFQIDETGELFIICIYICKIGLLVVLVFVFNCKIDVVSRYVQTSTCGNSYYFILHHWQLLRIFYS